jgi:hypothetical protein
MAEVGARVVAQIRRLYTRGDWSLVAISRLVHLPIGEVRRIVEGRPEPPPRPPRPPRRESYYVPTEWAQTQHSCHQPQSSGLDFAEGAKGEEKDAELEGPERLATPNRGRFRSARANGEILGGRAEGHRSPRRPNFTVSRPLLCGW